MATTNLTQATQVQFAAKDNGVEITSGLSDTVATFTTATAASIDVTYSMTGYDNDDFVDLDVWIETSGAVLLASAGGTWLNVDSRTSDTGTTSSGTLNFTTINTTASKADWDGAVVRYRQTLGANMGADSVYYITTTASVATITFTPVPAPVLTLPTEADITGTTATVGCTTDSAIGTLYWFVSTSATPPTAAALKAGTGAYSNQYGNIGSPGVGTETFSVDSLTQSGSYYTYFIHNTVNGDSNILESGIWYAQSVLTADDLVSATSVTTPVFDQLHILLADDLASATSVTTPVLAGEHTLLADDLVSITSVTTPSLVEDTQNELLADNLQSVSSVTQPALSENTEIVRPDADTSVGNWTNEADSGTNLYQSIDEVTANDTDYVQSERNPSASAVKFSLSDPTDNGDPVGNNTVSYRYRKNDVNSQQINLTIRLMEGASTVIASWTHTDITQSLVTQNQSLTQPQKDSISNYSNLFLEFEANAP